MSSVAKVLKTEIARISKKEAKSATPGDREDEYVAEEDCSGFEEKAVPVGEGEQAADSDDEEMPSGITPEN